LTFFNWLPDCLRWPFCPGVFIAVLAFVAAAVTFRKDPAPREKAIWIFAFLVLMVAEVWMMGKDRYAHDLAEREAQETAQGRFDLTMQRMEGLLQSDTKIEKNTDQLLLKERVLAPSGVKPSTYVQFDHTALVVSKEKPYAFVPNEQIQINFYYSNKTEVLAHDVSADGIAEIYQDGPAPNITWENREFSAFKSRWRAHPGVTAVSDLGKTPNWFTRFAGPLTSEDAALLQQGKKLLYIFGILGWKDGMGSHETEICSFLQPPGTAPIWHNCPSGHNTVH
jgi:hypothetical protein